MFARNNLEETEQRRGALGPLELKESLHLIQSDQVLAVLGMLSNHASRGGVASS